MAELFELNGRLPYSVRLLVPDSEMLFGDMGKGKTMKFIKVMLISYFFVLLLTSTIFAEVKYDLILQNEIVTGDTVKYAHHTITVGPNYAVESGRAVTLRAGTEVTLKNGFHAKAGSKLLVQIIVDSDSDGLPDQWEMDNFPALGLATLPHGDNDSDGLTNLKEFETETDPNFTEADIDPPVIISAYPANGTTVATQGDPLSILLVFGDASSISSVKLLDSDGNDITSQADIDSNTIQFDLDNPVDGDYGYILVLKDEAGNASTNPINFTVNAIIPVTTASIAGGKFDSPISVNLRCSEPARIYYSTDGYPPFAGGANTFSGVAPILGINMHQNTKLQFFAVDSLDDSVPGNTEKTKSEIYYFDIQPAYVTDLSAAFHNSPQREVYLAWSAASGALGYRAYRCDNAIDLEILMGSFHGGYNPPERFAIMTDPVAGLDYSDSNVISGATYWYGITVIDVNGIEGPVSQPVEISVPVTGVAQNTEEAEQRALIWLKFTQSKQGYWGDKNGTWLLATSQVLNALARAGEDNAGSRQALYYLRGHHADNNDFLARQIITLSDYGQNVDQLVTKLISKSMIEGTTIKGWGTTKGFLPDPMDTALASIASEYMNGFYYLKQNTNRYFWSKDDYCYGWIQDGARSVFASSFIYNALAAHYTPGQLSNFTTDWIIATQTANGDGSFGNGLMDTAAVLLWLDIPTPNESAAIDYLVSRQQPNGSWEENPYLTGLCLEALLKHKN